MNETVRHYPLIAVVILVGSCLLGGFLGSSLQADAQRPEDQLETFAQILALVEDNYIGDVESRAG